MLRNNFLAVVLVSTEGRIHVRTQFSVVLISTEGRNRKLSDQPQALAPLLTRRTQQFQQIYDVQNMDFKSLVTWENFENQNPYNAPKRFSDVEMTNI